MVITGTYTGHRQTMANDADRVPLYDALRPLADASTRSDGFA